MNTRPFVARIAQRTARALAVTALALGLSATILVPAPAQAGPLNPMPRPKLRPDLIASVIPPEPVRTGQTFTFGVKAKNQGSLTAEGVRATIALPGGFSKIQAAPGMGGFGPRPAPTPSDKRWCDNAGRVATCGAQTIAGGDEFIIVVGATAPSAPGTYTVTVTVDPDNLVKESSETNNITTGTITVY